MTNTHDPHGIKLKEYYEPERDWIAVVVSTSENPKAMVGVEKRYTDKQQFPLDFRHVNTIAPYILLHETMILAYVHLMNDAIGGVFINPDDGLPYSDWSELREKVHQYEQLIGYLFLYDYSADTVTLLKMTDENRHWADVNAQLDRYELRIRSERHENS